MTGARGAWPEGPLEDRRPAGSEGPEWDAPPPPSERDLGQGFSKFIMRAGEPPLYWIGVKLPLSPSVGSSPQPMTLLLASKSLGSGGLLFDFTPWIFAGAGVLFGSALFWFPLVRGMTRSLRQMTRAAGAIAQGQFDTEVDTARSDELGRLGSSLNLMAARLREFVTGQKRFLGDIAHELCSPLARMELALGVLDQRADEKQRAYVADVREEVRHMSGLLNELLSFTKAGLCAEIVLKPVLLLDLVHNAVSREGSDIVQIEVDRDHCVMAEPDLLTRAIANVIRNSIRYAGSDGPIRVLAVAQGDGVLLRIMDCGPGVPEESLPRLFDPFFRPEAARTRETGGAGLGLAIVKSCVEACGGVVAVKNIEPRGLEVRIQLRSAG